MKKIALIAAVGSVAVILSGCSSAEEVQGKTVVSDSMLAKPAGSESWQRIDLGEGFFLSIPKDFKHEEDSLTDLLMTGNVDVAGDENGQMKMYSWSKGDMYISAAMYSNSYQADYVEKYGEDPDRIAKPAQGEGFAMYPSNGGSVPIPSDTTTSFSYDYVTADPNAFSALITVDYGESVLVDEDKDGVIDYDKHIKNFFVEYLPGEERENQFAESPMHFAKFDLETSLDGRLIYDKKEWTEEFDIKHPSSSLFHRNDGLVQVRIISDTFEDPDGAKLTAERDALLKEAMSGDEDERGYFTKIMSKDGDNANVVAWAGISRVGTEMYSTVMEITGDKSISTDELKDIGSHFYNSYKAYMETVNASK